MPFFTCLCVGSLGYGHKVSISPMLPLDLPPVRTQKKQAQMHSPPTTTDGSPSAQPPPEKKSKGMRRPCCAAARINWLRGAGAL